MTEDGRLDLTEIRHIAEQDYPTWTRRVEPRPGDIIFTYEATLHRYAIIPKGFRGTLGRRVALLRPRKDVVDTRFLLFLFVSPQWRNTVQRRLNVGSTVDRLPLTDFPQFPIRIPPLSTQRKVAAILSAYDDLIENNNRRIKLVKEMTERIFREWFVDFRFPRQDGIPLVDSELGPIPKGWTVRPLGAVSVRVLDGDWIETKDQGGNAYRLLQVSNIGLGSFRETDNYRYISEDTFTRLRCTQIQIGSVLVSRMPDPIGRAWYVDHLDGPAVTAVDVAIVLPDPNAIDPRYCAFYLNTPRNLKYAAQRASGTTRLRITRRDLQTFPIPVPPLEVRALFGQILESSGEMSLALTLQNRVLRATRDHLLPRLISGEIDVTDLDIAMPAAAA
jgi:type I restriction enzyme S subunit